MFFQLSINLKNLLTSFLVRKILNSLAMPKHRRCQQKLYLIRGFIGTSHFSENLKNFYEIIKFKKKTTKKGSKNPKELKKSY
jgi:hypothetical protein